MIFLETFCYLDIDVMKKLDSMVEGEREEANL